MVIKYNTFYRNKTFLYLSPCMVEYGVEFIKFYNQVFKHAIGVYDNNISGVPLFNGNNIFILLNSSYKEKLFNKFMDFIRDEEYYISDYTCGVEGAVANRMLVLKIPASCDKTYTHFLKGEYSKMYTEEQKSKFFIEKETLWVINKTSEGKKYILNLLKKEYNLEFFPTEEPDEFDLPPKRIEEIFYYPKGKDKVFI